MAFASAPEPKSLLDYNCIISPSYGLRVSPLCRGDMTFGEAWKDWLGESSKDAAFEMLDFYCENNGSFIDPYVLVGISK